MINKIKKHYRACDSCMKKAGGVFPKGHTCTMTEGECKVCGEIKTLIPWVDYNWNDKSDNLQAQVARD